MVSRRSLQKSSAHKGRSMPFSPPVSALLASLVSLGSAFSGYSADLVQFNTLDSSASMLTTPARTITPSEARYSLGVLHSSKMQMHQILDTRDQSAEDIKALRKQSNAASSMQFGAGFGLNKRLQIDLGIGFESESFPARKLILESAEAPASTAKYKASGLSGFTLMTKLSLYSSDSTSIALAPFLESSAPASARNTMLRGNSSRMGALALYSFESEGILSLDLNYAMRSHSKEKFNSTELGLEAIAGAQLGLHVSDSVTLLAGVRSRSLETKLMDSKKKLNSSDFQLGIGFQGSEIETSFFLGSTLAKDTFASPREMIGMKVSYTVRGPEAASDAGEDARALSDTKPKKKKSSKATKAAVSPDSANDEYDMFQAIEKNDLASKDNENDFNSVKTRLQSEASQKNSGQKNIDEIDSELAKIREAEEKIRVQQTEQARRDEDLRMQQLRREIDENRVLEQKYRKDIQKNEEFPEFENESVEWNGLRPQNESAIEGEIDSSDIEAINID